MGYYERQDSYYDSEYCFYSGCDSEECPLNRQLFLADRDDDPSLIRFSPGALLDCYIGRYVRRRRAALEKVLPRTSK